MGAIKQAILTKKNGEVKSKFWASQSNAVLSGSIRDNLCLGLNRLVTDDELNGALDLVSLGDEIRSNGKEGLLKLVNADDSCQGRFKDFK